MGLNDQPPFEGIARALSEAATTGGDAQLRELSRKVKETYSKALHHALVESTTDIYGLFGASMTDPLDFSSGADDGWGSYPYTSPAYYIQNMKRGEVLPAYLYEQQLRIYRDRSRKLCQENEYAICATENRKNYSVGAEGFQYKIVSAKKERYEGMDRILTRSQWVADHWVEHNDMAEYAKDIVLRLDKDGEAFTRYFPQDSGLVSIRTVEAEHVRTPNSEYGAKYSFGIQSDPEDVETREGYWVVEDPSKGMIPNFVPADEVCHIKINTPRSAKRGLPTFYPCEQLLRIASDLLVGVAKNANHRAKIAMVRTVTGAMASAAASMLAELSDTKIMDPATGQTTSVEKFNWGTILTQPDNVKLDFPNANFESGNFDTALQMILRAVAARLVMPEWMLTVNAQNANFSSSLIAEAPSTKAFEDLQQMLIKRIGTNRMRSRESMLWYQIRHAVKVGLLPPETLFLVRVECQGPSLVVRDKTGESAQNRTYYEMRAKSKRIIQMENNWDPEQVKKDFEEDDAEQMELQQKQMQQQAEAQLLQMAPDAGGDGGPPPEDGGEALPQQFPESGPDGGPGAARLPAREGLEESVQPLQEAGFTGVVKDKNGTEYHYVDGKRVAHGHPTSLGGTRVSHADDLDDSKADSFAGSLKTAQHKITAILAHKPMTAQDIFKSMGGSTTYYNVIKGMIQKGLVAKNSQNQFVLVPKPNTGTGGAVQPSATTPPPAPSPANPAPATPKPTNTPPAPANAPTGQPNPYKAGSVGYALYDALSKAGGSVTASYLFKSIPGGTTQYNALKAMVAKGHVEKTPSGGYKLPGNAASPAQTTPPSPTPAATPAPSGGQAPAQAQVGAAKAAADAWIAKNVSRHRAFSLVTAGGSIGVYNTAVTNKEIDPQVVSFSDFRAAMVDYAGYKPSMATASGHVHNPHQANPTTPPATTPQTPAPPTIPKKAPVPTVSATQYLSSKWVPGTKVGGGRDNKFALEPLVARGLQDLGLDVAKVMTDRSLQHQVLAHISKHTDGTVSRHDVEYSAKNIFARESKKLHKPLFHNMGGMNGPALGAPDESRPQLTPAEKNAAQKYTSTTYKDLNDSLRADGTPPADLVDTHHHLQAAFAKVQPFPSPVDVTRGMSLDDASLRSFLDSMKQSMGDGVPVSQKGYISTAVGNKTDPNFHGNVTMRIKATQGIDLKPYTNYPHVSELLLNHDSKFKVTGMKQVGGVWEIEMEQIPVPVGPQAVPKPKKVKPAPAPTPQKDFTKPHESQAVKDYLAGNLSSKYTLHSNQAGLGADHLLQDIMKEAGRDGLPQVLDKAGIDSLHAKGWLQSFRGVKGAKFTRQFRTGKCFAGSGIYGNGIYTDVVDEGSHHTVRDAQNSARHYGKHIMRFAINPAARTIDHSELKKKQRNDISALDKKYKAGAMSFNDYSRMSDILKDDGRWAALHNYDLIKCMDRKGGYNVILNRSIIAVEDKDYS